MRVHGRALFGRFQQSLRVDPASAARFFARLVLALPGKAASLTEQMKGSDIIVLSSAMRGVSAASQRSYVA